MLDKDSKRTERNKKAMLEALERTLGVVTSAAKSIGVGRTQFYTWIKEDEEFEKEVRDIENIALDFAESQLHKQIKDGGTAATIFYLKTKGKKRGYVERTETIVAAKVNLDNADLPDWFND